MIEIASLLAAAWRIAFLTAAAPVVGAVLLLAIGHVTGARWYSAASLAAAAPFLPVGGALLGLTQGALAAGAAPMPWMSWWAVALRAAAAGAALSWASRRLRAGTGTTFPAVTLALYALVVTPLASDWMLGQEPGHAVSAIGMMQFTESVATGAAVLLMLDVGSQPFQQDMAKLMIAAALGLAYLAFMDYLIVWYGNLPSRVGFYLARTTPVAAAPVWAALVAGVFLPIAALAVSRAEHARRLAGGSVLAGSFLFNAWWVAGGPIALLVGLLLSLAMLVVVRRAIEPGGAHA